MGRGLSSRVPAEKAQELTVCPRLVYGDDCKAGLQVDAFWGENVKIASPLLHQSTVLLGRFLINVVDTIFHGVFSRGRAQTIVGAGAGVGPLGHRFGGDGISVGGSRGSSRPSSATSAASRPSFLVEGGTVRVETLGRSRQSVGISQNRHVRTSYRETHNMAKSCFVWSRVHFFLTTKGVSRISDRYSRKKSIRDSQAPQKDGIVGERGGLLRDHGADGSGKMPAW